MHISFSVDTDTLTPEQQRGLAMLLTGITVPDPYQVGPTPGEPEFEFKTEATIKRSEVEFEVGDEVVASEYVSSSCVRRGDSGAVLRVDQDGTLLVRWDNPRVQGSDCSWWIAKQDVAEVNGLKIIEDTP